MSKLKVLCLHGSRQDKEVFSQRVRILARKGADLAEFHFAEAPHELPLCEGQTVAMRAWWRHPGVSTDCEDAQQSQQQQRDEDQRQAQAEGALATAACTPDAVASGAGVGGGWDTQIAGDWGESLKVLEGIWRACGGFDAILGFSNGAAATFLLAAHVLARPENFPGRRLRCAVIAGGYVPQPLGRLLPDSEATRVVAACDSGAHGASQLLQPLRLPSLHIFSPQDSLVSAEQSRQLAAQFDASRSQKMEHELGHCVPQKAAHVSTILDFLSWFQPPPDEPPCPPPGQDTTPDGTPSNNSSHQPGGGTQGQGLRAQPPALEQQPPLQHLSQPELTPPEAGAQHSTGAAPTTEQQEEIEALQAIFENCCSIVPISSSVRVRVKLRDPSLPEADLDGGDGSADAIVNSSPSSLFALDCMLPEGYPGQGQLPTFQVLGPPLAAPDQMPALQAHLADVARENVEHMSMGCIYQVVEAAKEWLDANLPSNFVRSYAARNCSASNQPAQPLDGDGPESHTTSWWDNEEADAQLVAKAIAEASASRDWLAPDLLAQTEEVPPENSHPADTTTHGAGPRAFAGGMDVAEVADSAQHGRWDFVVGLVGKPSAGKSSFFNAVTQPVEEDEGARVAGFPFTTIDPQTGRGFAVVPDPATLLGPEVASRCKPLHGYAPAFDLACASPQLNNTQPLQRWLAAALGDRAAEVAWRRVPVAVKDVAGLVPGAYQGRGRGNAFLNDLCEASVLVHVVDASGCTDKEGRAVMGAEGGEGAIEEGGDPLADIGWVREEIHRWVFNNVRTKWPSVRRRPSKLCDLFSGYHAPQALVHKVLEHVGLPVNMLLLNGGAGAVETVCAMGEADLHRLVATFLSARFPILLALNKCDTASAPCHIRRIREALPQEPAVAMSAATERWLATASRKGQVVYQDAAPVASVAPGCEEAAILRKVAELNRRVLGPFGSTGALLAISTAVAMRPPAVVYPVGDLATCTALPARAASGGGVLLGGEDAKARAAEGNSPSVLRDAVLMKPGSTPADLFSVLHRPPWQLLEANSQFVRAEAIVMQCGSAGHRGTHGKPSSASRTVLKKDDVLGCSNCVVRIMVNRKGGGWQKH